MVSIARWQAACACVAVLLAGCAQPQSAGKAQPAVESGTVAVGENIDPEARERPQNSECRTNLRFAAATVYAGATDYYFTTISGEELSFRVENETAQARGFEALTTMGEEGPPEANIELIGEKFEVCSNGVAIAVERIK